MSLPKFETDISYISKLDDEPNDVGGLDASQLKAEFDKAGLNIQEYINDVLLPYLEGVEAAASLGIATISGLSSAKSVQEALEALKAAIDNTATGSIPDASLTGEKLAAKTIGSRELADAAVSAVNISAEAVTEDKVAPKAVTSTKLAGHVVTADKLADGAVTNVKLADGAVDAGKLDANAVTNAKIANGAVSTGKIASQAVTAEKLADHAVSVVKSVRLPTTGWTKNSDGVYEADVTVSGLKTTDTVVLGLRRGTTSPDGWTLTLTAFDSDRETFSKILAGRITAANTLHLYAEEAITNAIYLNCWVVSK